MRLLRILPLLAATLLLSACASWFRGSDNAPKPADLPDIKTTLDVNELWSAGVGSGNDGQLVDLRPAVADGRVYAADRGGDVMCFDAKSGRRLWDVDTKTRISGAVGVGLGMALVGTSDAQVIALDAKSGKRLWQAKVSSEVLSVPRAAEGLVVVHSIDGKIFGLNAATGAVRWTYDRSVPVLTLRGTGSPVLAPGAVIAGLASGKLAALKLDDGQQLWETRVSVPTGRTELERMVDIDADPVVIGSEIYVATYHGRVAGVDLNSGRLLWVRKLSSHAGLAADASQVYVTDDDGTVWALDRESGRALWKQDKLSNRGVSAPAVVDGYVVVGDYQGYLHWMSRDDGRFVARTRDGSDPITASPLARDGNLYVLGSDGDLAVYRPKEQKK